MRWETGGESDPTAILCSDNFNQIATVNDALDGWEDHARLIAFAPRLHGVARRVVSAFRAIGNANGAQHTLVARQECEAAMIALDATLAELAKEG